MSVVARATSALGIANAGRALAFAVLLSLIAGAVGLYLGKQWQVGVEARADLQDLEEVLYEQREQLDLLREIRLDFAEARERQREFHDQQRVRLLDWMLAPGAADGARIGAAGLGLWNAANAGTAAGPAGTGVAGPVPAPATGTRRLREDAGGEPRQRDGSAGRLRDAPRRTGGVGRDREH